MTYPTPKGRPLMDTALLIPSPVARTPQRSLRSRFRPGLSIGVSRPKTGITPAEAEALDRDGYVVLEGVLDADQLHRLRHRHGLLTQAEGLFGGAVELTRLQAFAASPDHAPLLRPIAAGLRLGYRAFRTLCLRGLFPLLPRWRDGLRSDHGSPGFGAAGDRSKGRRGSWFAREFRAAATAAAYFEPGAERVANLVNKDAAFDVCLDHPRVRAAVQHLLGEDARLSSLNARAAQPDGGGAQPLHTDWESGARDGRAMASNTLWILDDFTEDNGATRIVPGTHRTGTTPAEELADPMGPVQGERKILAPAGSVIVLNAHVWHGGTTNRTRKQRRIVQGYFARRGLPQQLDQNRALRSHTVRRLSPDLLRRIGALDPA